jgi:hypothetical protein
MLPGAVSHPDGNAVHFDVLHGAANEVIGQLCDLGWDSAARSPGCRCGGPSGGGPPARLPGQ